MSTLIEFHPTNLDGQGKHRNIRHEHHCCRLRDVVCGFSRIMGPLAHMFGAVCVGADKVSMAHAGERIELERAFSGATVHDMFNM